MIDICDVRMMIDFFVKYSLIEKHAAAAAAAAKSDGKCRNTQN